MGREVVAWSEYLLTSRGDPFLIEIGWSSWSKVATCYTHEARSREL